jgi:hypothetical protein
MPFNGTLTEMRIKQNKVGAGPNGATIAYQVFKNDIPQAMSVTMNPSDDNAVNNTAVAFSTGNDISVQAVVAGADLTMAPQNIIAALAFTSS